MAQRKPEEQVTLDQVLRLIDKLSPDDQEQLRLKLDRKTRQQNGGTLWQPSLKTTKEYRPYLMRKLLKKSER